MQVVQNYYQLLCVNEDADPQEIKRAFRKLAQAYHPDKHKNSPESAGYFKVLLNAYSILSDEERRKQYDLFLKARRGLDKQHGKKTTTAVPERENIIQTVYNQLNMFLWDIEDFLRELDPVLLFKEYAGIPLWIYVGKILKYIDKWVFNPNQFVDHVFSVSSRSKVAFSNYFYDIRVRVDKYFKDLTFDDLVRIMPGYNMMKIDVLFEVFKHTTYYLTNIKLLISGEISYIPDYTYQELLILE